MFPVALSIITLLVLHQVQPTSVLNKSIIEQQWNEWKRAHNKHYQSNDEHDQRRAEWTRKLIRLMQHNVNYDLGLISYSMRLNSFSDLSDEEFVARYASGSVASADELHSNLEKAGTDDFTVEKFDMNKVFNVPSSIDWRDPKYNYVRKVRDQSYPLRCGSCYAFSAVGAIEGQYMKNHNKPLEFSEQQVVDCSGKYGNNGCDNGTTFGAFQYAADAGLELDSTYRYVAKSQKCQHKKKSTAQVKGIKILPKGDEQALMAAVGKEGPVSVNIDARFDFDSPGPGIWRSNRCTTDNLTHSVLVVGYGSEQNVPFWIIKNSWGSSWGEKGYIRLARNAGNMCGVASFAIVPAVR